MTIPTIEFEAIKWGFRQTKDGTAVTLMIHPQEIPDEIAVSPIGARYQCVLVRLGDDDQPQAPQEKRRSWNDMKLVQQAGIACNDEKFIAWARRQSALPVDEFVRKRCGVHSRSQLDRDPEAGEIWKRLYAEFKHDTI